MAKLIVWNLVTLDGHFEGKSKWDLDFHNAAWGPELEKLSIKLCERAGTLVFGRVTYDGMAGYWRNTPDEGPIKDYMNSLPKLVASRTITSSDWNNTRVTADIESEVRKLKAASDKDIFVFGSAELVHSLLEAGLVDEILLCIVPGLLGEGTPLFKKGSTVKLTLQQSTPLSNGAVILSYVVTR